MNEQENVGRLRWGVREGAWTDSPAGRGETKQGGIPSDAHLAGIDYRDFLARLNGSALNLVCHVVSSFISDALGLAFKPAPRWFGIQRVNAP